ncbi:MAG: hypothetical protein PHX18_04810 [Candidatus Gastranaerophilales bacterium]|nr:hypothetical protein [Candidatus Gastranaerophilales bacterium]
MKQRLSAFDDFHKKYFVINNYFLSFNSDEIFKFEPQNNTCSSKSRYYFELKKIVNLPCPCCGRIMTTRDEMNDFVENIKMAKGQTLIEELTKYEGRIKGIEKQVLKKVKINAKKHPDKNLKELFKQMYRNSIQQLENSQQKVIAKVMKLSDGLEGRTYITVKKDIKTVNTLLQKRRNSQVFKRKTFITSFYKLIMEEENPRNKKILELIAQKAKGLPTSGNSTDAFIVKYHRRRIDEIAQRLLDASLASTEHVNPRSCGGVNDPSNYLVQCKYCNSERSSLEYKDWLKKHPEMKRNIQVHIDKVISLILNEQINGYDFYPLVIKYTLVKESKGLLDINIENIIDYLKYKYLAA